MKELPAVVPAVAATLVIDVVPAIAAVLVIDAVAMLLRFPELVPHLKPTSVIDPVTKE